MSKTDKTKIIIDTSTPKMIPNNNPGAGDLIVEGNGMPKFVNPPPPPPKKQD